MEEFPGSEDLRAAEEFIRQHINSGYPVPYLLLKHTTEYFYDFVWHWFLCYGSAEKAVGMCFRVATYGRSTSLILRDLWMTGFSGMGG